MSKTVQIVLTVEVPQGATYQQVERIGERAARVLDEDLVTHAGECDVLAAWHDRNEGEFRK